MMQHLTFQPPSTAWEIYPIVLTLQRGGGGAVFVLREEPRARAGVVPLSLRVVKRNRRYIFYDCSGRLVKTELGAEKDLVLKAIAGLSQGAFSAREIARELGVDPSSLLAKRVIANMLGTLYKEGIVVRSSRVVRTKGDLGSYYLYVVHTNKALARELYEEYLVTALRAQGCEEIIEVYLDLKHGAFISSSIELTSEKPLDLSLLRSTFCAAGLLSRRWYPEYSTEFFWGSRVPPGLLEDMIKGKAAEVNRLRAEKVNLGRVQQKRVHEVFARLIQDKRLAIVFDDIKYEPRLPFASSDSEGGKAYIMPDTACYGFLCIRKDEAWEKLGNQRLKFRLFIESKNTLVNASMVSERLLELQKLNVPFVLIIAAKGAKGSLWQLYENNYFLVMSGAKLDEFLSAGSVETEGRVLTPKASPEEATPSPSATEEPAAHSHGEIMTGGAPGDGTPESRRPPRMEVIRG